MNIITIDNPKEQFQELYDNSAYTITGVGGDLNDWINGYNEEFKKRNIGIVDTFYTYTGKQMNSNYKLKGNNKYPEDITFLSFKLDGLDVSKLAMFKLITGDRWFDDIVDNNRFHNGGGKQ